MVEYVESDGRQCLNSFYTTTADTKLLMDFTHLTLASQQKGIIGNSWGYYPWFFSSIYGNFHGGNNAILAAAPNVEYLLCMGQGYTAVTNKATGVGKAQSNKTEARTINLLNCSGYQAAARIHALQIFEGASLVRDYWPSVNPEGVAGLYDVVNGGFYPSSSATAFIAGPEGRVDALSVTSTHPDCGEPTCTRQTGYGAFLMADGETATVTMPETTVSTPVADMQLLGWRLVVTAADGSVTTNESVAATFDTCTYAHAKGNRATLLWRWKRGHRITATAGAGLSVTCSPTSFDEGETVTVRFTVSETTGRFVGWEGAGVPDRYRFSTNFTMSVSEGFAVCAQSATNVLYAAADGEGDGSSWAAAAPLQRALDLACATPGSMVCAKAGLYGIATANSPFQITNTVAPFLLSGGYTGSGFEKGGETFLARTDSSVQTRILDCSAATFCAEGLVVSNGWTKGSNPSAVYRYGQGVRLADGCVACFRDCLFRHNTPGTLDYNDYYGGAIGQSGGTLTVEGCHFGENRLYAGTGNNIRPCGGAIAAVGANLFVERSQFMTNWVQDTNANGRYHYAGAIYLQDASAAEIADSTFAGNYVIHGGLYLADENGVGGALRVVNAADLTIRDSLFDANWAQAADPSHPNAPVGGTMVFENSNTRILRTVVLNGGLSGRSGYDYSAGSVDTVGGSLALTNVLIAGVWHGWALGNRGGRLVAKNCTVAGTAGNGWNVRPAVGYRHSSAGALTASASFEDCIFWDNAGGDVSADAAEPPTFSYCLTQNHEDGVGNVVADPLFADETYFHPQSRAGRYGGGFFTGGAWTTADTETSPAIDLDKTWLALAAEPQPNGHHVNAGYDGNLAIAGKSDVQDGPLDTNVLGVVTYADVVRDGDFYTFYGDVTGTGDPSVPLVDVTLVFGSTDAGTGTWERSANCGIHAPWDIASAMVWIEDAGTIYYRFVAGYGTPGAVWGRTRTYVAAGRPEVAFAATPVTHRFLSSAQVHLELVSDGGVGASVSVTYWKADESEPAKTVYLNEGNPIGAGAYDVTLEGLSATTDYKVRVTASNSAGEDVTTDASFSTTASQPTGVLPAAYTPLAYVELTGKQWLDPFYTLTSDSRLEMWFRTDDASAWHQYMGKSWSDYILQLNNGKWSWNNAAAASFNDHFLRYGQGYRALTNLTAGTGWQGTTTTSTGAITLFSSGGYYPIKARCYKVLVYEGVVLARNFWPCKDPNGVAGLYDTVGQQFYPSSTATAFAAGPDRADFTDVFRIEGSPKNYGTPVGEVTDRYGCLEVDGGQVVTVTMPEHVYHSGDIDAQLLGWRLEVTHEGVTTTTESTPATFDACTYTHVAGDTAKLVWLWQGVNRITVTADPGLVVTQDRETFVSGETVDVNVTVRENGAKFVAWEGVPGDRYLFSTNFTMRISDGITLHAHAAETVRYAAQTESGLGDGLSWADATTLQKALDASCGEAYSLVCVKEGLHPVTTEPFVIGNTAGPVRIVGGFTGTDFERSGRTTLGRVGSGQSRILDCSAATFCAEGLVISNGYTKGSNPSAVYRYGQGVRLADGCVACFRDCLFRHNTTGTLDLNDYYGGAIGQNGGTLTVEGCHFGENRLYAGTGNNIRPCGGAIAAVGANLFVERSQFMTNWVQDVNANGRYQYAGAIYLQDAPAAEIADSTFAGNYVTHGDSCTYHDRWGFGGAMRVLDSRKVTIRDSLFDGNCVRTYDSTYPRRLLGGTMSLEGSEVTMLRTVIRRGGRYLDAPTQYCAGGVDVQGGTLAMTNVVICDTWAGWALGNSGGTITAKNCTIAGLEDGGCAEWPAVAYFAYSDASLLEPSSARFENCILWGNPEGDFSAPEGCEPSFAYSVTETPQPGTGNLSADPLFEDGFYHVKSAAGNYAGGWFGGGTWVTSNAVTSPAIDVDPAFAELATEPQPNGGHVNAGYDGNTAVASKSVMGEPPAVDPSALGIISYPDVTVGATAFTFHADVTGLGAGGGTAGEVFFCWGAADGGTSATNAWENAVFCGAYAPWQRVAVPVALGEGTVRYRFMVKNALAATAWSNPSRAYTAASRPSVAYDDDFGAVTHLYHTSAKVRLVVADGGSATTVEVAYWADGTTETNTVFADGGAAVASGKTAVGLKGLAAGTTYRAIATARNARGATSTAETVFTTPGEDDALVLRVGTEATGTGDGHGWAHLTTFAAAVASATGTNDEILVRAGRYTVNPASCGTDLTGRTLVIRGGYGPAGERGAGETVFTASDNGVATRVFKFTDCTITLDSLSVVNGHNTDTSDRWGLAIGSYDSTLTVTNCSFRDNGNYNVPNNSTFYGGAIGVKGGAVTAVRSAFIGNQARHSGGWNAYVLGGAIGATDSARVTVRDCSFARNWCQTANSASSLGGGAIGCSGCASLTVENTLFMTNYVYGRDGNALFGGALHVRDTPAALRNLTFVGDWAYGSSQYVTQGYDPGGSIYCVGSTVSGENLAFLGTGAYDNTYATGGLSVGGGTVSLTNVLFAAEERGASLVQHGGTVEVVNGTFADAKGLGARAGAAYSQYTGAASGTATFRNCIFWGNAGGFQSYTNTKMTVTLDHCDVQGATPDPSTHVTSVDPIFYPATHKRAYHLRHGSPCVGIGDATIWTAAGTDLDGLPRLHGGKVDLGCYSFSAPGFMLMLK